MKQAFYNLEFLTPCFCAGANQARAEIRAPALRGQLRWWFRALGGNPTEESKVFGGLAGNAFASNITTRIYETTPGPSWTPPARLDINSDSYVYYFVSVSGTEEEGQTGPRWQSEGALSPGTRVKFGIQQRCPLTAELQTQFNFALRCFLQLGAVGLRATRGLGTFSCQEVPFQSATLQMLKTKGFFCETRPSPLADCAAIAREIGGLLKGTRKATGMKFDRPSPFGYSLPPERQTSAIYFRPVRNSSGGKECSLVVFEAPHDRVLVERSRGRHVIGNTPSSLTKPTISHPRY